MKGTRKKTKNCLERFLQHCSIFGFRRGRIGQWRGRNPSHQNRGSHKLAARWNRDLQGVLSGLCVALGKATMKKVEKHESVKRMAESSLNTVNDLVSRALKMRMLATKTFIMFCAKWKITKDIRLGLNIGVEPL